MQATSNPVDGGTEGAVVPVGDWQPPTLAAPALTLEEQRARRRERLPSLLLAARQQLQLQQG